MFLNELTGESPADDTASTASAVAPVPSAVPLPSSMMHGVAQSSMLPGIAQRGMHQGAMPPWGGVGGGFSNMPQAARAVQGGMQGVMQGGYPVSNAHPMAYYPQPPFFPPPFAPLNNPYMGGSSHGHYMGANHVNYMRPPGMHMGGVGLLPPNVPPNVYNPFGGRQA